MRKYEDIVGSSIPLIAAGGIFTGGDIHRFLSLGASGVLMATRFVTTHECDAHINFKELYVQCREKDVTIIDSPLGLPGRAIESSFLQQVRGGTRMPLSCKWQCLKGCDVKNAPYCIARALLNARDGNLTAGFAFAGQNAWRCDDIYSVKEVFEQLKEEYARAVESEAAENHD
ncbi:MAG: nitronate monooxygenase [Planctomycetota bacterium]|nr:nitronate monooxygenase [Planctomycetota bacterium]